MTKKRSTTAPESKEQSKVALNEMSVYTKAYGFRMCIICRIVVSERKQ